MNSQQRRSVGKNLPSERIEISGIVVHFGNAQYVNLDLNKAEVVDKDTKRPLFKEVLDGNVTVSEVAEPEQSTDVYVVEFETPEGTMIFSKNGDFSGIKKK